MTQSYPENLKAISIHAPHAYAICMGIKKAEYRSQPTERRGWILIHASQSKDSDHCLADYGIPKDAIKRGAIIGAAQIIHCTWDIQYSCYAYLLANPILFNQPIEGIKGCQAIFWGAKTPDKQAAFAQAWEMIPPIPRPEPPASDPIPQSPITPPPMDDPWETITPPPATNSSPHLPIPPSPQPPAADPISQSPITPPSAADSSPNPRTLADDSIPSPQSQLPNHQSSITPPPGYRLESQGEQAYQVFDSLTDEPLWQIQSHQEGWMNGLTKKTHSSPLEALLEAREKTIERIERSASLEVSQADSHTFIVRNPGNGNHYAVRPHYPNHEKCECGDAYFRGVRCKHQIAVDDYLQQSIAAIITPKSQDSNIQFISPDDFFTWEAIIDGKTIATINYDSENFTQQWAVTVDGIEIHRANTQAKAENYIRWHHKQGTLPRFEEEEIPAMIEDCNYIDEKGQQYAFRLNGQLIGYIWLGENYWTNGDGTKYGDWRECGLKLARLWLDFGFDDIRQLLASMNVAQRHKALAS